MSIMIKVMQYVCYKLRACYCLWIL